MKQKWNWSFGALDPRNNSWQGIVITLFFISFGGYIIYKHRKETGFWWGIAALALLSTHMIISPKPVVDPVTKEAIDSETETI